MAEVETSITVRAGRDSSCLQTQHCLLYMESSRSVQPKLLNETLLLKKEELHRTDRMKINYTFENVGVKGQNTQELVAKFSKVKVLTLKSDNVWMKQVCSPQSWHSHASQEAEAHRPVSSKARERERTRARERERSICLNRREDKLFPCAHTLTNATLNTSL